MTTDAAARATITRAWMAWVAVCVIWGTTYLGIKIALDTIPPFLMGGLRYTVAGLLLAIAAAAFGVLLAGSLKSADNTIRPILEDLERSGPP